MVISVNQTSVCLNVLFLFLFCTLIFSSSAAFTKVVDSEVGESLASSTGEAKRLLRSSEPPTCTAMCGKCKPCKPVLVATPPPAPLQTDSAAYQPDDYVPQIWKCMCGGKYYNPHK